jgi:hypothetical protein
MQLTIHNKGRFPHAYALKIIGGRYSAKGEEYYEDHEEELQFEYTQIMESISNRLELGSNNQIHSRYERKDL